MDLFAKYALIASRHDKVLQSGADPFGVCLEKLLSATEARINGRDTILAGTNNYLGLTFDRDCMAAATAAIRDHGTGTTGSRIANGTYGVHRELEAEIARFLNRRSAMIFPTGYQANLGMLAGLAGPRDVLYKTRMPVNTSISPLSIMVGQATMICFSGLRSTLYNPGSRSSRTFLPTDGWWPMPRGTLRACGSSSGRSVAAVRFRSRTTRA